MPGVRPDEGVSLNVAAQVRTTSQGRAPRAGKRTLISMRREGAEGTGVRRGEEGRGGKRGRGSFSLPSEKPRHSAASFKHAGRGRDWGQEESVSGLAPVLMLLGLVFS